MCDNENYEITLRLIEDIFGDYRKITGKAADEPEKVSDEPENVSGGSGQGADPAAVPQESFSISDLLAGRRSGISGKEDVP